MDKDLLIKLGVELAGVLVRAGLEFARTLGVSDEQLDEAFSKAKADFIKNDPTSLPKFQ